VREDGAGRTYGLGLFITVFVLIALAGLIALLVLGGGGGPTQQLSTRQTVSPTTSPDTDESGGGSDTASEGEATMPDGSPAPDDVQEVRTEDGVTSYVFEVPSGVTPSELEPSVAPTRAQLLEDGSGLVLQIGCAASAEEFLAQVSVGETEDTVTVAAVSLAPAGAAPCADDAATRRLQVPLAENGGDRSIVVVPPGTDIPDLETT
jgi:hypothetical protein